MLSSVELRLAAQHLVAAQQTGQPTDPVRDMLDNRLDAAYDVQEFVVTARESGQNPRVGRKLSLISAADQARYGASEPCFGVLLNDMDASGLVEIPVEGLLQPRIQAEVAFILGTDVFGHGLEAVEAAVMFVVPALGIVDSRVRDWDITVVDGVADNASCGLFVAGQDRVGLIRINTADIAMELKVNGQVVSTGHIADSWGDAIHGLLWLVEAAEEQNRPLRAGEIILSGPLGPTVDFPPGAEVEATLSGLGRVTATRAVA
jgi:2-keto-4-pentenoate hydratase